MTIYLTPPAGGGGVANVASGTTTVEGTVRLATTVEAQDVNNETLAVTPKGLNAQIASAIAGGVTYEGTIAGDNIPTLTTATQGQLYKIDTASSGVVAGFNWSINDNLLINADMGGTFDANKINKIDSTDSDLATVATTGAYSDLTGQPTNLSQFNNDQGYITNVASASTTTAGIIEIADPTETSAGTSNALAVSPLGLATELGNLASTIPSSSDDLTSDHDPTNYTGALNGSLTTHLAGIDTALGNALSGTTDSILEGQAKVETIDTGSDARIEFSADPNGTGTEKIWEFNSSGHLIPNVNDTYDIGSAEKKVRDLYLGSSTLYMGGTLSLGIVDGNLRLSGGGNLEVGASTVLTDATLPSIPGSSADLSDGADLLKTGDIGVTIGDIVEVVDVGGSVAGISALDGSNLTNLTYANITGTPNLATVATSGDYNDLTNTPSSSSIAVATLNTTNNIDASVNTAYYSLNAQANDNTFTLPDMTNLSDGDVIIITRRNAGDIIIRGFDHNAGTPTQLIDYFGSNTSTRTITCYNQQIYIRYESASPKWYVFDKAQAQVATTGDYNDLTNTPTDSDDFTANLNPTNYLNVNNTDTITAHLGAIDTALGNVGGASGYPTTFTGNSILSASANNAYIFSLAGTSTPTVTLPDNTSLNDGDVVILSRVYAGQITINQFDTQEANSRIHFFNFGYTKTRTFDCNRQQIHLRWSQAQGSWFFFDYPQSDVATSGDYNDLSNTPTNSDDFTANLNPTNYLNVNNTDTITAHLSSIDTALGNAGSSLPTVNSIAPGSNVTITTHTGIEEVYIVSATANIDIELPSASTCGSGYKYNFKSNANGFTIRIVRALGIANGTELIDNQSSVSIINRYESLTLVSNGSNWFII
jgi:hypothetical protein